MASDGKKYKLKYFDFRVLGEPIRWQFSIAGIPFEDERLPRDTWDAEGKPFIGFGKLPILEIDDGHQKIQISQSSAILRYLGSEFGLLPETPLLRARADELVDNLHDLRLLWRPYARESDPTKRAIIAEELVKVHFPFYLPKFEAFLSRHGQNGFAVGGTLSWADLFLANLLQIWTEKHGHEILDECPLLRAQMIKILNIPQVKGWNSKRLKTGI